MASAADLKGKEIPFCVALITVKSKPLHVSIECAFLDYLFYFNPIRNGHNGQPCALKGALVTQQAVAGDYEREVLHFYANITNSDSTMVTR